MTVVGKMHSRRWDLAALLNLGAHSCLHELHCILHACSLHINGYRGSGGAQYLLEVACPIEFQESEAAAILQWLLQLAVSLAYQDNGEPLA